MLYPLKNFLYSLINFLYPLINFLESLIMAFFGHFDIFWCGNPFLAVLDLFWTILGHFWLFWHFWPFWHILAFFGLFGTFLKWQPWATWQPWNWFLFLFWSLCPTGPPQSWIKLIALTVLEIAFLHISGNPEKSGNPEIF